MSERDVRAEVIGRRYDCDQCGKEMHRYGDSILMSSPPKYPHTCPNGHVAHLSRSYPGYDVFITQDPTPAPQARAGGSEGGA